MARVVLALVLVAVAAATLALPVLAQKPSPPATGARLNACTILSREEVKKIFPWSVQGDQDKETEMPLGGGSACVYPSVQIYVGKYSAWNVESARKDGALIPTAGIGDEAFLQQKGKYWAELYIKAGDRLVHIEKEIAPGGTLESVKSSMVALGNALVAKLR